MLQFRTADLYPGIYSNFSMPFLCSWDWGASIIEPNHYITMNHLKNFFYKSTPSWCIDDCRIFLLALVKLLSHSVARSSTFQHMKQKFQQQRVVNLYITIAAIHYVYRYLLIEYSTVRIVTKSPTVGPLLKFSISNRPLSRSFYIITHYRWFVFIADFHLNIEIFLCSWDWGGRKHGGRLRQGDVQGVHRGGDEALPRPVQGRVGRNPV